MPWASRMKVTVAADDETTLAEVIDQAAPSFGISARADGQPTSVAGTINGVGFWRPGDDENGANHDRPLVDVGVDENGAVVWRGVSEIRMGDLRRAAHAGLLEGDPNRVYLAPLLPQGDLDLIASSWKLFWDLTDHSLDALGHILDVYGAYHLLKDARGRLGKLGNGLRAAAGRLTSREVDR